MNMENYRDTGFERSDCKILIDIDGTVKILSEFKNGSYSKEAIHKSYVNYRGVFVVEVFDMIYVTHLLIAYAFKENPEKFIFIRHVDGDILNNSLENLKWCSGEDWMNYPSDYLRLNIYVQKSTEKNMYLAKVGNKDGIVPEYDLCRSICYGETKIEAYNKLKSILELKGHTVNEIN